MTMVIRFELRIRDQIGPSVSFDIKNGNPPPPPKCWHFEDDCVPNGSTGKVAGWGGGGGSYLFMKYDVFRQNADFFLRNGADQLSIVLRALPLHVYGIYI